MKKFENIKQIGKANKISSMRSLFHKDTIYYNMQKIKQRDFFYDEVYWRRKTDYAGVNKIRDEINWMDYSINLKCHKVIGYRCD